MGRKAAMRFAASILTALASASLALAHSPAGYTPSGTPIFPIPRDAHMEQSGNKFNIVAKNGTVIHVIESGGGSGSSAPGPSKRQMLSVAVDASASPAFNDTLQAFNATFVVPPLPTTFESQLFFLTGGIVLVDDNGPGLYMAAGLQYGGTNLQGGPYWTLAVILQGLPGTEFSQLTFGNVVANPGETYQFYTTIDNSMFPLDNFTWYVVGINSPTDPEKDVSFIGLVSDLESDGVTIAPIITMFRGQEEGVTQATDYPVGDMVFEDISVNLLGTGIPEGVTWGTSTNATMSPGLTVQVQTDGASDGKIAFGFPDSD
ncbi:hypothetical protein HMN09_01332600 [Mycena chlorophos]|uniref:PEP-CTERM sorting domain-containing protein n=1 Tax=Mycena chlorophos TaxID=658473 RepID=A0A8H6RZY7_MYCCL|nr:hypothetical protein HMN09_01332600 [Mycena chlorophos]